MSMTPFSFMTQPICTYYLDNNLDISVYTFIIWLDLLIQMCTILPSEIQKSFVIILSINCQD